MAGSISGIHELCIGSGANFFQFGTSGDTGGLWSSTNPSAANVSSIGLVTALDTGSTIIRYIVTNSEYCYDNDTALFTIRISRRKEAGLISGTQYFCFNDTISNYQFYSSGDAGGIWESTNPSVASISSIGLITVLDTGNTLIRYIVFNSSACGNDDTASFLVIVNKLANAGQIFGMQNLCVGRTSQYISTGSGGVWRSTNQLAATIDSISGVLSALSVGNTEIIYVVNGRNVCPNDTSSVQISISKSDTITLDTIICSPNFLVIDSVVLSSSGTYYLPYINAMGCDSILRVQLTILNAGNLYTINDSNDTTFLNPHLQLCLGDSLALQSTVNGGIWDILGNNRVISIDSLTGNIRAIGQGSAVVVYKMYNVANNCSTETLVRIVVQPRVRPIISGQDTLCLGNCGCCYFDSSQLVSSIQAIRWYSGDTTIASVDSLSGVVRAISPGIVWIYLMPKENCIEKDSVRFVIGSVPNSGQIFEYTQSGPRVFSPSPNSFCTAERPESLCIGDSIRLGCSDSSGSWSSSDTSIAKVDPVSGVVRVVGSGFFEIIYTVSGNFCCRCSIIKMKALLNPIITGPLTVCLGDSISYSINAAGGQFTSSNPLIASIDPITGELIAHSQGSVVLFYGELDTLQFCTSQAMIEVNIESRVFLSLDSSVCDSLNWYGTIIRNSGIYIYRRSTPNSCDSIIQLKLQIISAPSSPISFDTSFCFDPSVGRDTISYPFPLIHDLLWFNSSTSLNPVAIGRFIKIRQNFDVLNLYLAYRVGSCISQRVPVRVENEEYAKYKERPTAFTPNQDGINDEWKIQNDYPMELMIFNRWGQLIHNQSSEYDSANNAYWVGWNGKVISSFNEYHVNDVYTYRVVFLNCTGKEKVWYGTIQLIR